MAQKTTIEDLGVCERRFEIMIAARLKRKDKIEEAIEIQDRLSKKSGSWEGAEEIRKWRSTH